MPSTLPSPPAGPPAGRGRPRGADAPPDAAALARERWVSGALALLGEHGVGGVRIEVLARRLGVTKGGFYWHFRDRETLLAEMLAAWVGGRRAAAVEETRLRAGETVCDRLTAIMRRTMEKRNRRGLSIELAIRDWSRADRRAAAAVAAVDGERLDRCADLLREGGFSPQDARDRAFLLYAVVFGQALITSPDDDDTGRSEVRTALADTCARILFSRPPAGAQPCAAPRQAVQADQSVITAEAGTSR